MTRFAYRIAWVLLPLAALSGQAGAFAIYTVGSGGDCTHGTIQSAIDAADASPGYDVIRLTRSLTYQSEDNTVETDQDLSIVGGFETCTQSESDGFKTVVSGQGGDEEPVFRINALGAAIIKLRLLTITGGDEDGAGFGGGIYFHGTGNLEISESDIINNTAGFGGGILAVADGTNSELIIGNNTTISGNTARYSGGGVFIAGPLEMTMTAPSTIIAFNQALDADGVSGYGGGLEVGGPAIAYIGSPGSFGLPAIYGNFARYGGGISVTGGNFDGADAAVQLFTTDPALPVSVSGNSASELGGGIYLRPYLGTFETGYAWVCASDFRIDDNLAQDGTAIYSAAYDGSLDIHHGGRLELNAPDCTHAGATHCAAGVACNTVWGNGASTVGGEPTDGAAIRDEYHGILHISRTDMRGNRGGYVIRTNIVDGSAEGCLLVDNQVTQQLIRNESADIANFSIQNCTLAHNVIGSTDVIHAEDTLTLSGSIIDQPGNLTLAFSGDPADLHVSYVLASDSTSLPDDPTIYVGVPSFVDAANGDYHLRLNSFAVDFAPPVTGDDRDLDRQPRDQNMVGVPDEFGVRDLGAYERQVGAQDCGAADTILCNGFES